MSKSCTEVIRYVLYISLLIFISHFCDTVSGIEYFKEKPSYIQTCKLSDPEFSKCSLQSSQKLWEEIIKGIPELIEKMGTLDPYKPGKIVYRQDGNEGATIHANLSNLAVTGFSKMQTKYHKINKKDYSWATKIVIPKLRLEGKYKMEGKILIIPLNGAGRMFIELSDLETVYYTTTRLYEKDGFTFYNVTGLRVDINMNGLKTHFDNIFNGNSKDIEEITNNFFNENWRDFYEVMRPVIYQTVEKTLIKVLRAIFGLFPANFFIEDIPTSQELYGNSEKKLIFLL